MGLAMIVIGARYGGPGLGMTSDCHGGAGGGVQDEGEALILAMVCWFTAGISLARRRT